MTLKETIDTIELKEIINNIWYEIEDEINNKKNILSSEKTVVFRFAWLINYQQNIKINVIDFERVLFDGKFSDGKFLDLFLELEIKNSIYRIGFEFKFPNKKAKNSGQTEVRQKIINDIKRLDYLIFKDKIDLGVFLCATNEKYYPSSNIKKEPNFIVHESTEYKKGKNYPINDIYNEPVKIGTDIKFNWRNIRMIKNDFFTFLEPIYLDK